MVEKMNMEWLAEEARGNGYTGILFVDKSLHERASEFAGSSRDKVMVIEMPFWAEDGTWIYIDLRKGEGERVKFAKSKDDFYKICNKLFPPGTIEDEVYQYTIPPMMIELPWETYINEGEEGLVRMWNRALSNIVKAIEKELIKEKGIKSFHCFWCGAEVEITILSARHESKLGKVSKRLLDYQCGECYREGTITLDHHQDKEVLFTHDGEKMVTGWVYEEER